jgi:hypothetical protein
MAALVGVGGRRKKQKALCSVGSVVSTGVGKVRLKIDEMESI